MRTYIGLIRDHSGSMGSLRVGATNDYNLTIEGIKNTINSYGQEGIVTVVECGVGYAGSVRVMENLENIKSLKPLTSYDTSGGGTPLLDSVATAIDCLQLAKADPKDAFLIMVITDGGENASKRTNAYLLAERIRKLQATDKWTFVFRVPKGYSEYITRLGIPSGNIMEWEQTEKALVASTQATQSATASYFNLRSHGHTSTNKFYTDLTSVPISEIKKNLEDITDKVQIVWVPQKYNKTEIRGFCEEYFGEYSIGSAYYQLNKAEKVQASKKICIKHKKSGKTYSGADARDLLGLPHDREVKVIPSDHGQYEVFIQSTSTNRHLVGDTRLLYYWKK